MRKEYQSFNEVKIDHPNSIDLIEYELERNKINQNDFIKALQYETEPGNENLILVFKVPNLNNVCYVEIGDIEDPFIEEFYEMNKNQAEFMFNN